MLFTFLTVIMLIIYLALLELSKNTLAGWIIAVFVVICWWIFRARRKASDTWNARWVIISLLAVLILLGVNYFLTAPPIKQAPAVEHGIFSQPAQTEVIHVTQGDLTGVYNKAHTARIYAGIPYAAPPTGERRWKEPDPPAAWEGVRVCDTFAPMAMQQESSVIYSTLSRILGYRDYRMSLYDNYIEAMSEDCLYLNIFAPADMPEEPVPVLFYIHGGSLMTGKSSYTEYRGESLAEKGIIVVNIGYRLGVFGYLASEELTAESPNNTTGNYGLLDQIAALSWVRDNISAFGGDPDQITIAGESAGASCVNALCVSPLTEGMFVRAIADSSSIVAKKPYHTFRSMEEALETGRDIMKEYGAADIDELRRIPAEKLIKTSYDNSAMTLDGYAIREMPYLTYEKGENHEQALLNGFNTKEADAFIMDVKATNENYVELLRDAYKDYAEEAAETVPAGSIIRDEKLILDKGGEAKGSLDHAYSAAWFTYSHELWSRYMAAEGRPVYEYYFSKTNRALSNHHAGELVYFYGNMWRHPGVYDDTDYTLSEQMQRYIVNFVRTGDPNGDGLPVWELRDISNTKVLELNVDPHMTDDPYRDLYPILDRIQEEP